MGNLKSRLYKNLNLFNIIFLRVLAPPKFCSLSGGGDALVNSLFLNKRFLECSDTQEYVNIYLFFFFLHKKKTFFLKKILFRSVLVD